MIGLTLKDKLAELARVHSVRPIERAAVAATRCHKWSTDFRGLLYNARPGRRSNGGYARITLMADRS